MKKLSLVSLLFVLSMMLLGCSATSDNEVASNKGEQAEKQTHGEEATQELPSKEQPTTEGNITEKKEMNQTEADSNFILYENNEYGFTFSLPKSWEGYQIVTDSWEGTLVDQQQNKNVVNGPILKIRHPKWTEKIPRQDIPIMIFTQEQWLSLEKEEFHVGAAPVPPKRLGQNDKYVFALPPRYNFAFPEGFEEVEDILKTDPLQPKK
jgi:hypothetical protein